MSKLYLVFTLSMLCSGMSNDSPSSSTTSDCETSLAHAVSKLAYDKDQAELERLLNKAFRRKRVSNALAKKRERSVIVISSFIGL